MSAVLKTEVQIAMDGSAKVIQEFNQIAQNSRKMHQEVAVAHDKFTGLSKVIGHMAGAGRYEFMAIYAAGEAVAAAGKSWGGFLNMAKNTAVFAGAAAAMGIVISKAKSLAEESDKMWDALAGGASDETMKAAFEKQKGFLNELKMGMREIATGDVSSGIVGNLVSSIYAQFTGARPDRVVGIDFLGLPSADEVAKAYEKVTESMLSEHRMAKAVIARQTKEESLIEKQAMAIELEAKVRGIRVEAIPQSEVKRIVDGVKKQVEQEKIELNLQAQVRMEEATGRPTWETIAAREYMAQQKSMEFASSTFRGSAGMTGAEIEAAQAAETERIRRLEQQRSQLLFQKNFNREMAEAAQAGAFTDWARDRDKSTLPSSLRPQDMTALQRIRERALYPDVNVGGVAVGHTDWVARMKKMTADYFNDLAAMTEEDLAAVTQSMEQSRATRSVMEANRATTGRELSEAEQATPTFRRLHMGTDPAESAMLYGQSLQRGMIDLLKRYGVNEDRNIVDAFQRMVSMEQQNRPGGFADPTRQVFQEWAAETIQLLKAVYASPETAGFFQKRRTVEDQVAEWQAANPAPWMNREFANLTPEMQQRQIREFGGRQRQFIGQTQEQARTTEMTLEFSKRFEEGRLRGKPDWAAEIVNELKRTNPTDWFKQLGVNTERQGFGRAEQFGDRLADAQEKWRQSFERGPMYAGAAEEGSVEAYRAINENLFRQAQPENTKEIARQQLTAMQEMVRLIQSNKVVIYQLQ